MSKTTKSHFNTFKAEGERWLKLFGLSDWNVDFIHSNSEDEDGANATCWGNIHQKYAKITMYCVWDDELLNKEQISMVAFHEVLELLLMELRVLSGERYIQPSQLETAIHSVIQRLTNSVWRKYYGNRKI